MTEPRMTAEAIRADERARCAVDAPTPEPPVDVPEVTEEDVQAVRELPFNLGSSRDGGARYQRILAALEWVGALRAQEGR